MPEFSMSARSTAPVEEVWKLLHDPYRFPEWWEGMAVVQADASDEFTFWYEGYPDLPMPQRLSETRRDNRVVISCQVSDIEFTWQLVVDGSSTSIDVHVVIPVRESHRLADQQAGVRRSLERLADLAAAAA